MQSRYYDSEVGRFINADDVEYDYRNGNVFDNNIFQYCNNSPISLTDKNGHIAVVDDAAILIGIAAIVVFGITYVYIHNTSKSKWSSSGLK